MSTALDLDVAMATALDLDVVRLTERNLELERENALLRRWLAAELAHSPPPPFLTNDVMVLVAAHLSVRELGRLACVARRFALEDSVADPSHDPASEEPAEAWSLVQEAARLRWLSHTAEEQQRAPRDDKQPWLALLGELERLTAPLAFTRAATGYITLEHGGAQMVVSSEGFDAEDDGWRTAAACAVPMRAGLHFAQFTIVKWSGDYLYLGLVRADWDVEGGTDAEDVPGHCLYCTHDGHRRPGELDWEGMQGCDEGDQIGMLVDIDAGTLTVYKNGVQLGVMDPSPGAPEGWRGLPADYDAGACYCWAVSAHTEEDCVRIETNVFQQRMAIMMAARGAHPA